jgi:mannose-6-phosphate isomerase-like protein (cupin superfamily)
MVILSHSIQPLERWRDGVMTRMRVSMLDGARQLCIFEQFCDPGSGAPAHFHHVEEVLEVIQGIAEIQAGDESAILASGQSVLIPAGTEHRFINLDGSILHVRATLASPSFEATYLT